MLTAKRRCVVKVEILFQSEIDFRFNLSSLFRFVSGDRAHSSMVPLYVGKAQENVREVMKQAKGGVLVTVL